MSSIALFFRWLWSFTKDWASDRSDEILLTLIVMNFVWVVASVLYVLFQFSNPANVEAAPNWAFLHNYRGILIYPLLFEIGLVTGWVITATVRGIYKFIKGAVYDWREYKARHDLRNR